LTKKDDSLIFTMIIATRPWSFTLTIISVLIGTFIVSPAMINWLYFILVLAGMIILHAATNVLNDYFDHKNGIDFEGAPTTLYRKHPLVSGAMKPKAIFMEAVVLYCIAGIIGLFLILQIGWPIAVFAAIGGFASIAYTGWYINYKYRALGEIAVFLMWGPLMIFSSYYIQVQNWDMLIPVVLIAIPHGLWVTLVILANNLKDIDFDNQSNIKTAGTILKKRGTLRLYRILIAALYIICGFFIAIKLLPVWSILVILSLPKTIGLIKHLQSSDEIPANADPVTAQTGTIFGILFAGSLILGNMFPIW
jgi:1,4-dihydroxy-2-naphthoate octaprenyltransferase